MAIVPIKKIALQSLHSSQDEIIAMLYREGFFQIIETKSDDIFEGGNRSDVSVLDLDHAISVLSEYYVEEKLPFAERMSSNGKIAITKSDFDSIISSFDAKAKHGEVIDLEKRLIANREIFASRLDEIELLEQWKNVTLPHFDKDGKWMVVFGKVPVQLFDLFSENIEAELPMTAVDVVNQDDRYAYLTLVLKREEHDVLKRFVLEYDFEEASLPYTDKSLSELLAMKKTKNVELEKEISHIEKDLKKLADSDITSLKVYRDHLLWMEENSEVSQGLDKTARTFTVLGWIQEGDIVKLKTMLSDITDAFVITELEPEEGEKIPVALKNNRLITPFEAVTAVYGSPKAGEVDPTPYLAPFFIVFFALCLTDAGYGIVLALVSWLAIKILKIPREKSKMFRLMIYAGIVTTIVGALFGGWFGIVSADLPPFLQKLQVINPLEDVMTILGISAVLGLIQIIVGIVIKVVWAIKHKIYSSEVAVEGLWSIVLTVGGVFLLANSMEAISFLVMPLQYILYVALFLIVFFSGKDVFEKKREELKGKSSGAYYALLILGTIVGLPIRIITGVLSLYTIINYVSDILSYSRLLALGLATGIIAMAINIIAAMIGSMIPVVGVVLTVIVLVVGHLFNLGINVLGAYIHSGRLQFVEFFPKFIEGGGEIFNPIKREGKYIELQG